MCGGVLVLFFQTKDLSDLSREEALQRLAFAEGRLALSERKAGTGFFRRPLGQEAPYWSPGLYRILGRDPFTAPDPAALISAVDADGEGIMVTAIGNVLRNPGPFFVQGRLKRPDGSLREVEISGDVETDDGGHVVALVGIMTDVTARVEAEEQLRAAMDAFRLLTEEANDMICRHDTAMKILYCSPALTRMLGYDPSEVLGSSFVKMIHQEDRQLIANTHAELLRPGAAKTMTMRMRHRNGGTIWIETVCRSVAEPGTSRVAEIITVSRDITVRKEQEMELKRARDASEEASRTKSRFLASMSHELRTPLNAIIGFSEMMKDQMFGPLPDRYVEYSGMINESGSLLLSLITDILDMSKIEAGRFDLVLETIDPDEVAASCLRVIKSKAMQGGLSLHTEIQDGLQIEVDTRALKQILLNLLSNAVKFTPQGGEVTLSIRAEGCNIAFVVQDTGIGIPADQLPRLGNPFEQAKQDAAIAKEGTGLGLALVKAFAGLHGGAMKIESTEGMGTTVTVTLPTSQAGRAQNGVQQAA